MLKESNFTPLEIHNYTHKECFLLARAVVHLGVGSLVYLQTNGDAKRSGNSYDEAYWSHIAVKISEDLFLDAYGLHDLYSLRHWLYLPIYTEHGLPPGSDAFKNSLESLINPELLIICHVDTREFDEHNLFSEDYMWHIPMAEKLLRGLGMSFDEHEAKKVAQLASAFSERKDFHDR